MFSETKCRVDQTRYIALQHNRLCFNRRVGVLKERDEHH
jgi:hypothetical protein